jgi:hypothetical protein
MRQGFVESADESHAFRVSSRDGRELLFDPVVARAEYDELRRQGQKPFCTGCDEVYALLRNQSAHDAAERYVGRRVEIESSAQLNRVSSFVDQTGGVVVCRECGIRRRIPGALVDAVEYADEACAAARQETVHAESERLRLDLSCVGRADGGDAIRIVDAGLEKRHLTVVFDALDIETLRRQPKPGYERGREIALVREVVDGQQ